MRLLESLLFSMFIILNARRAFPTARTLQRSITHMTGDVLNPSGLLAVYKPKGWTSNAVVGKVKYILRTELQARTGQKSKVKVRL